MLIWDVAMMFDQSLNDEQLKQIGAVTEGP